MWKYNNKIIRAGKAWKSSDGTQHPSNWMVWSDAEKTAAGMTHEADVDTSFDNRFYWSAGVARALEDVNAVDENGNAVLDEDGVQVVTLGLKSQHKARTKQTAGSLLADTDWMVVRSAENGTDVPQDVLTYRANVRSKSGSIETAIAGAANHAAFMALFDATYDSDGNQTAPAPINDWPASL